MLRRERWITLGTFGGLTVAFFAAVHLPGRNAEAALREKIARSEAEIARGPQVLERFQAARQELSRRGDYLERSAAAVAEPHDLLAKVSRVANASGLVLVRLEPEPVRPQASYVEHPFRLDFRGDLASLAGFLHGLEQDSRFYAIEELLIQKPGDKSNGANLEGSIRLTVFAAADGPGGSDEENGSTAPQ